jgi:superfamily II DNA helicase RecQ
LDPDHPNFDSEEEYGREDDEDSSEEEDEEMEEEDEDMDDEYVSDLEAQPKKPKVKEDKPEPEYKINTAPINEHLIKREATLIALLKRSYKSRVIIFSNEKVQCTRLAALLNIYGFKAAEVHGNMEQRDRLDSVEKF